MRRGLFLARFQTKRRGWALTAEADIGDEAAFRHVHECQSMGLGGVAPGCHPNHPTTERLDGKSEGRQHVMKKGVMFVAIAATTPMHEFGLQRLRIDFDRTAEKRIQCLKRDPVGMAGMKRAQHREGCLAGPSVPDAVEVGGEINAHSKGPSQLPLPGLADQILAEMVFAVG